MARVFLYIVAACVVLVLGAMIAMRYWATDLSALAFVPKVEFTPQAPFEPKIYAHPDMWLARPGLGQKDSARYVPDGFEPEAESLGAAVFFVHPTSYFEREGWNAALGEARAREQAGRFVRSMASPFNRSADLWAPRYRQATLGAFLTDKPAATKAIDAAYRDVLAAFDYFVATIDPDRPIVLAGHSQGAFHLRRLIAERIKGTPLKQRIAVAYLIGWPISLERDIPRLGLPACTGPDEPGCVVGWQSFAEPRETGGMENRAAIRGWLDGTQEDGRPFLCSNPLDGMGTGARPASANAGSLVRPDEDAPARLVPGMIPARCSDDGYLLIGDPPDLGPWVMPGNNYHVYDIPMFWADLRRDVDERVEAWQAAH